MDGFRDDDLEKTLAEAKAQMGIKTAPFPKPKQVRQSSPYDQYIEKAANDFGVDPDLIRAIMSQESSFKPKAVSPKGARGLMQLMPDTARRFGVTNIYDPQQNISGGTQYMRWLLDRFGGNVDLALAGYNAGEGAVDKYKGKIPPYRETQNYVQRIRSNYTGAGYRNAPTPDFSLENSLTDAKTQMGVVDDGLERNLAQAKQEMGIVSQQPEVINQPTEQDVDYKAQQERINNPASVIQNPNPSGIITPQNQVQPTQNNVIQQPQTVNQPTQNFFDTNPQPDNVPQIETLGGLSGQNVFPAQVPQQPQTLADFNEADALTFDDKVRVSKRTNPQEYKYEFEKTGKTADNNAEYLGLTPEGKYRFRKSNGDEFDWDEQTQQPTYLTITLSDGRKVKSIGANRYQDEQGNKFELVEKDGKMQVIPVQTETQLPGKNQKVSPKQPTKGRIVGQTVAMQNPQNPSTAATPQSKGKKPDYTEEDFDSYLQYSNLPKTEVNRQRFEKSLQDNANFGSGVGVAGQVITPQIEGNEEQWSVVQQNKDGSTIYAARNPKVKTREAEATVENVNKAYAGAYEFYIKKGNSKMTGAQAYDAAKQQLPSDVQRVIDIYERETGQSFWGTSKRADAERIFNETGEVGVRFIINNERQALIDAYRREGEAGLLEAMKDTSLEGYKRYTTNVPSSERRFDKWREYREKEAEEQTRQDFRGNPIPKGGVSSGLPQVAGLNIWSGLLNIFSDSENSSTTLRPSELDQQVENRMLAVRREFGSFQQYRKAQEYAAQMSAPETASRLFVGFLRGFVNTAISGTLKGVDVIDKLIDFANPFAYLSDQKEGYLRVFNYMPTNFRGVANILGFGIASLLGKGDQFQAATMSTDADKRLFNVIGQRIDEAMGDDKYLREWWAYKLANGLGSGAGFMMFGLLAPNAQIASRLGNLSIPAGISGAITQAGSAYEQAKKAGLSEGGALGVGLFNIPLGASEMFGIGSQLNRSLGREGQKLFWREFGAWLKATGREIGSEGLEEALQEFFQSTGGKAVLEFAASNDPNFLSRMGTAIKNLPRQARESIPDAIIGFVTGGTMKGGITVLSNVGVTRTKEVQTVPVIKENTVDFNGKTYSFNAQQKQTVEKWQKAIEGIESVREELGNLAGDNTAFGRAKSRQLNKELQTLQGQAERLQNQAGLVEQTEKLEETTEVTEETSEPKNVRIVNSTQETLEDAENPENPENLETEPMRPDTDFNKRRKVTEDEDGNLQLQTIETNVNEINNETKISKPSAPVVAQNNVSANVSEKQESSQQSVVSSQPRERVRGFVPEPKRKQQSAVSNQRSVKETSQNVSEANSTLPKTKVETPKQPKTAKILQTVSKPDNAPIKVNDFVSDGGLVTGRVVGEEVIKGKKYLKVKNVNDGEVTAMPADRFVKTESSNATVKDFKELARSNSYEEFNRIITDSTPLFNRLREFKVQDFGKFWEQATGNRLESAPKVDRWGKSNQQSAISNQTVDVVENATSETPKESKVSDEPKVAESKVKEPYEMTKTEWNNERELAKPNTAQSRPTANDASQAISRMTRLSFLGFDVNKTAQEQIKQYSDDIKNGKQPSITDAKARELIEQINEPITHRKVIESALKQGKTVPSEVLADYPDLAEKYGKTSVGKSSAKTDKDIPQEKESAKVDKSEENISAKVDTKNAKEQNVSNERVSEKRAKIREPRQPKSKVAQGKKTKVKIPDSAKTYEARYVVRELDDIIPSHNPFNFQPNEDYFFVNDRQYDKEKQYQEQVRERSKGENFDASRLINNAPTVEVGAPVIDADGNVLGGNSRSMMLYRIYKDNGEAKKNYHTLLIEDASVYGLDAENIRKFKQPVLVRELSDRDIEKQEAITELNKSSTTDLTPSERAVAEAGRLSDTALDYITRQIERAGVDATLNDALNLYGASIINKLIDENVFTGGERNTLLDGSQITADGKKRIERMLLGRIFADLEQMEYAPPYLKRNLERAVSSLVKTQTDNDWNIIPETQEAVDLLTEFNAKGKGLTLEDYAEVPSFVRPEKWSPKAIQIANVLRQSPNSVSRAFKGYAKEFQDAKDGTALFGAMTPQTAFGEFFGGSNTFLRSVPRESEINLENLYDEKGNVNYEKTSNVADRIRSGSLAIERLDSQSEQGRIRGGQRNVEASLILAGETAAGQKTSTNDGSRLGTHSDTVRRQEQILERYAKANDIWFKQGHFPERLYVGRGGEALVYEKDANRVVKLIDYRHIDKSLTPQQFIENRISLFNHLFPESHYELMGFMRDAKGTFRFIVTQQFIQGSGITNQAELDAMMAERGFERTGRESYGNELYQVHDLHVGNVLKDVDGNIFVIDAVPKFNTEAKPFRVVENSQDQPLRSVPREMAQVSDVGFYSTIEQAILDKMPNRASAEQIKGLLNPQKTAGIKQEELDWLGIDEFLSEKDTFTKDEVLEFIRANQVDVKEVVKADFTDERIRTSQAVIAYQNKIAEETGFDRRGGITAYKKELRERFPKYADKFEELAEAHNRAVENEEKNKTKFSQYQLEGEKENYREIHITAPNVKESWKDGHPQFEDIENPVIRLRVADRTDADGAKSLMVEEMQPPKESEFEKMSPVLQKYAYQIGMKTALRMAVEGNYDKILWTTGEQQAERYSLAKSIEQIKVSVAKKNRSVELVPKDARSQIFLDVNNETGRIDDVSAIGNVSDEYIEQLKGTPLDEAIGKEMAEKILSVENGVNNQVFQGEDLKVGGQGLKNLYNKTLPFMFGKYTKKWGGKVGTSEITVRESARESDGDFYIEKSEDGFYKIHYPTGEVFEPFVDRQDAETSLNLLNKGKAETVHSLTITDAMRESVAQGQPLFKRRTAKDVDTLKNKLPFMPLEDVLAGAESTLRGENLELNEHSSEIVRRLLSENNSQSDEQEFDGITMSARDIQKIVRTGRPFIETFRELGYTDADLQGFTELLNNLEKTAKRAKDYGILYVYDDVLPEEETHREDLRAGRTDQQAIDEMKQSPFWTNSGDIFNKEYPNLNDRDKASEIAAKLATDQADDYGWNEIENFEEEKQKFLDSWADGIFRNNENVIADIGWDAFANKYQRITKYGNYQTANNERQGSGSISGSVTETGEKIRTEPIPEKPKRESEGIQARTETPTTADDRARIKEAWEQAKQVEAEGKPLAPAGNLRLASLPQTMRGYGIDAIDVIYEKYGDLEATDEAVRLFNENGIDGSIKLLDTLKAKDQDAHHTILADLVYKTMRDNALDTNNKELLQKSDEFLRDTALKLTQTGRTIRAVQLAEDNTALTVIKTAEKIAEENGTQLDAETVADLTDVSRELENANIENTKLKRDIRNLKAQKARLKKKLDGGAVSARKTRRVSTAKKHLVEAIAKDKKAEINKAIRDALAMLKDRPLMSVAKEIRFEFVTKEVFEDAALALTTLDLEDSQVIYPKIDKKPLSFLFNGIDYALYVIEQPILPESGAFEISIQSKKGKPIGFIRATKSDDIISINLIHIQENFRNQGIGTDIYEKLLEQGFIIKSDTEITDATFSLYDRLALFGYERLVFPDGRIGLKKAVKETTKDSILRSVPKDPIDPQLLEDVSKYGGILLTKGIALDEYTPTQFKAEMEAMFGKDILPYMTEIHAASMKVRDVWLNEQAQKRKVKKAEKAVALDKKAVETELGRTLPAQLTDKDVLDILGLDRDEKRKKDAVEKIHRLATNVFKNKQSDELEAMIIDLAPTAEIAQSASILAAGGSIADIRANVSQTDAQKLFVEGANIRDKAKQEIAEHKTKLEQLVADSDQTIKDIEYAVKQAAEIRRNKQRQVAEMLDRLRNPSLVAKAVRGYKTTFDLLRNLTFSGEMSYQMRQAGKFIRSEAVNAVLRRLKKYETVIVNNGIETREQARESLVSAQKHGLKTVLSHENFLRSLADIENHPSFKESLKMGVKYSNLGQFDSGGKLGEEELQSEAVGDLREWFHKRTSAIGKTASFIPDKYLGLIQRFDEAMGVTLDTVRLAMYDRLRTDLINQGFDPKKDKAEFEALAKRINTGTGRPNEFKNRNVQGTANFIRESRVFGSPSYTISKWQDIGADFKNITTVTAKLIRYLELPKGTQRIMAVRAVESYGALMVKYAVLAYLLGAVISFDPDDDDFLKLRVPFSDFRRDLTGGNRTELKLIGQAIKRGMEQAGIIEQKKKVSFGRQLFNYNLYKVHNAWQFTSGAITGKDAIGQPFSLKDLVRYAGLLAPMTWVEVGKIGAEYGAADAASSGVQQFFGIGVNAYPDRGDELDEQIRQAVKQGKTAVAERLKKVRQAQEKKKADEKRKNQKPTVKKPK